MTSNDLARLFVAPEIVVVDLAAAALAALHRGLLAQHPMLVGELRADQPLIRRRAMRILRRAQRLQQALDAYRAAADQILNECPLSPASTTTQPSDHLHRAPPSSRSSPPRGTRSRSLDRPEEPSL